MKANSQRGVALVITLIMLSLITFLTVAFLATSRRERSSVTTSLSQTEAKLMADTALARAQAEAVARMMARTSLLSYDLNVSRNFINPTGYDSSISGVDPINVNFDRQKSGAKLTTDQMIEVIGNLLYDPRAPVFIKTNDTGPGDFRFFLDYDRSGRFETNGVLPLLDSGGQSAGNGFFTGDPEWIGVLEHPDFPHSGTNRFIGRYAFIALPIGKTLDLNYIHNQAVPRRLGYARNMGAGSWELNLAAFLADLNSDAALTPNTNFFTYSYGAMAAANFGTAFQTAQQFINYRYGGNRANLPPASQYFVGAQPLWQNDGVDWYSDGPLMTNFFSLTPLADADPVDPADDHWSGSRNPQFYYTPQELFNPAKASTNFTQVLTNLLASPYQHDRYAYYRFLAQIGTDSAPETSGKMNLNYNNVGTVNGVKLDATNLVNWTPVEFFTNAVTRIMSAELQRNITNINVEVYNPTNRGIRYTSRIHQLFQLAANIYEATTTNRWPVVFRPTLMVSNNSSVYINGFAEEISTNSLSQALWREITDPNLTSSNYVYGIPFVIGAKKFLYPDPNPTKYTGYPNFNEFSLETTATVTRKLEMRRALSGGVTDTNGLPIQTNQMYIVGISNVFGVEAWNSYTQAFPGVLAVVAMNTMTASLTNETGNVIWPGAGSSMTNTQLNAFFVQNPNWPAATNADPKTLPPSLNPFRLALWTNVMFLTNSQYIFGGPPPSSSASFTPVPGNSNLVVWETSPPGTSEFPVPTWVLNITNRLRYWLIDQSATPPRIVDFVNIADFSTRVDIMRELLGAPTPGGNIRGSIYWQTNRTGGSVSVSDPTSGIQQQINTSLGDTAAISDWGSSSLATIGDVMRTNSVVAFARFVGVPPSDNNMVALWSTNAGPTTNRWQTPFNPSRKIYQRVSWAANDPFVHYTVDDLIDWKRPVIVESLLPLSNPSEPSNLGELNENYSPWGGRRYPNGDPIGRPDYDLTLKDPLVRWADDWEFPTNNFATVGWLGRVHRGSPWQSIYFKSGVALNDTPQRVTDPYYLYDIRNPPQNDPNRMWDPWSPNFHPTNDWRLADVFTVAPNDNASRGTLSVNQTNLAAWSAVLSGVLVLTNANLFLPEETPLVPQYATMAIEPGSPQLQQIVAGINAVRQRHPAEVFTRIGDLLAVPELTLASPFINTVDTNQIVAGLTDELFERIPQQILSLVKVGQPRFVIYSYGQSLKPAERSLVLTTPAGRNDLFNLATNYQITGEVATRTVLRIEETSRDPAKLEPKVVIESFNLLPSE
jgi:hypothetical protein